VSKQPFGAVLNLAVLRSWLAVEQAALQGMEAARLKAVAAGGLPPLQMFAREL
jgi:hypothetical protein